MKMTRKTDRKRPATVAEHKLDSRFNQIRQKLLGDDFAEQRLQPLAFWALPTDRRLPLALLDRKLEDLLALSFQEILATPGVGQKKLSSLIKLLNRATKPVNVDDSADMDEPQSPEQDGVVSYEGVSEALWAKWRETVVRHGVGDEKLGLLAPTLQALPTVIWNTPLNFYVDRTLGEIRDLKTHGEKRVRVVLEVFAVVHRAIGKAPVSDHLQFRLKPALIDGVSGWIAETAAGSVAPSLDELRDALAKPLLEQIRVDLGDNIGELATDRVGLMSKPESVRRQAREAGLTRARIYQLFEDCAKAMQVRWPEGRWQLLSLASLVNQSEVDPETRRLFQAILDLFYPHSEAAEESLHDDVEAVTRVSPTVDLDRPIMAPTATR